MKPTVTDFLSVLFRPGEATCYAKNAEGTTVFPIETPPWWVQFFSINPIHPTQDFEVIEEYHAPDRPRRADANVTAFRNILIELDKMPLEQQRPYMESFGVPWSTCVFSGGKSYHFIISMSEPFADRREYELIVAWLHNILKEADHATKNPSRLSRFPGVTRVDKGKMQELIEVRGSVTPEALYAFLSRFQGAMPPPAPVVAATELPEGEKGHLSHRTRRFLMHGAEEGQRNIELHQAARDMHQNGWTLDEAEPLLFRAVQHMPGFSEKEFLVTIRGAFRKPPKFPPRV